MNCSDKLIMTEANDSRYPFAGPAVVSQPRLPASKDLSDWVDLMELIEMLCPVWPERDLVRKRGTDYRL